MKYHNPQIQFHECYEFFPSNPVFDPYPCLLYTSLTPQDRYITIVFCELAGDKLVTKGTYAKMARGEMVRFIAENNIENPAEIQKFDRLGYSFRSDLSSDSEYVFERKIK